jgi:hypothetical protein
MVWTILFGIGTVCEFQENSPRGSSFLVVFFVGEIFLWLMGGNLKRVFIDGDQIVISNYFKTCRIPISQINSVSENILFAPKIIYITFNVKTIFGQKIKFIPRGSPVDMLSYFGGTHSIVKYMEKCIADNTDKKKGSGAFID